MSTKRNAKGMGTIRQRQDGRWEARYTLGRDPWTGKQIQKSLYGKSRKEAQQKLLRTMIAIEDGFYSPPCRMTLGEWLDIWLAEYAGGLKTLTMTTYEGQIQNRLKPSLGAVRLSELSAAQIQRFYNLLLNGSTKVDKLAPKTIKNIHGILHKALKQAVELGYLKVNPSDACKLPRVAKAEIKPLNEAQIGAFLQTIKGHPLEKLFIVALFTGMRQGEVLGLAWDCIDFDRGSLLIKKQLIKERTVGGQYLLAPLKNDKMRRITPAPSVMQALQGQKRTQEKWRAQAGEQWENSGLVFTNQHGRHLVHSTVYRNFKNIVKQIGIPQARFHDLRHSYAVAALRAGDDVKTVQETLGHYTAAFTLDVYGHVSEQMRWESAQRMEGFIQSVRQMPENQLS